jgi:hypothetical protein
MERREEGHVKTEAGIRVMKSQAKELCEPLVARKARKDYLYNLILDFWPLGLSENKFFCFNVPNCCNLIWQPQELKTA